MKRAITAVDVDLELVLAVDVSHSMSGAELVQQRNGYVAAFRHPEVLSAIRSGELGRIAVAYVEWAGPLEQRVVVPWTIITGADDAAHFAETLAFAEPKPAIRTPPPSGGTSISSALLFASALFGGNDIDGMRQTIDISGDGPNNTGPPVGLARDTVLARGVTINGLPLILAPRTLPLDDYYKDCVIGGPGSFSITVSNPADFSGAVRHKLLLEIADLRRDAAAAGLHPPPRSSSQLCDHWHRRPSLVGEPSPSFPGKHYLWTD